MKPKKVTMWMADNGEVFSTEAEAITKNDELKSIVWAEERVEKFINQLDDGKEDEVFGTDQAIMSNYLSELQDFALSIRTEIENQKPVKKD